MRVYELIECLQKCNKDDFVYYDVSTGLKNSSSNIVCFDEAADSEGVFSVDDVLIGSGTLRGAVYLTEEKLEEDDGK